jgi:pimeloyl-ACP methyl ester carboxylesterase
MQLCIAFPEMVRSLTLVAPLSPYGFGGTRGLDGTLCFDDAAGSGGAAANPDFVERLAKKDAGEESDFSPRNVFRSFYVHQHRAKEEDDLVASMLSTVVGDDNYPGTSEPSDNWPTFGPGTRGMNNAISPRYCNLSAMASCQSKPPVLWIRGDRDAIVSDNSMFDLGALGAMGAVPGWPGADVFPAQPMVGQTRALLERYAQAGGRFREEVISDCGHTPFVEKREAFLRLLLPFLLDHR